MTGDSVTRSLLPQQSTVIHHVIVEIQIEACNFYAAQLRSATLCQPFFALLQPLARITRILSQITALHRSSPQIAANQIIWLGAMPTRKQVW
jgi:hypothetical protein